MPLIAVEGIEGSGLTTTARLLAQTLRREGKKVLLTKEPWLEITHILGREHKFSPVGEALLFAMDRAEHAAKEIIPALKRGYIVITDRYLHSSLAYQHAAGLPLHWIGAINRQVPSPDIVIFLDTPVDVAIKRTHARPSAFAGHRRRAFLAKVRENYLKLAKRDWVYVKVDERAPVEVYREVRAALRAKGI